MKKYLYKILSQNGTFLKSFKVGLPRDENINAELVLNKVNVVSEMNGGQGRLMLNTNLPFDDFGEGVAIENNFKIELYLVDNDANSKGKLLFSGVILSYQPYLTPTKQGVNIEAVSDITELNQEFYDNGAGAFVFTKSAIKASDLFKNVIDRFRTVYTNSNINYSGSSVEDSLVNTKYDFDYDYYREAIETSRDIAPSGWWWSIDQDGLATLKSKPATATHRFILGKNINIVRLKKTMQSVYNRLYLEWENAGTPEVEAFNDATSQSAYGIRAKFLSDLNITDTATRDERGDSFIAENKDVKNEVNKFIVNNEYEFIENIKPGDTCSVFGTKKGQNPFSTNMQILKTIYNGTTVELILEKDSLNFAKAINNNF